MQIERKGDVLTITIDVSAKAIANGHMSTSGKNWLIDTGKLQSGEVTVQLSAYQRQAPAPLKAAA